MVSVGFGYRADEAKEFLKHFPNPEEPITSARVLDTLDKVLWDSRKIGELPHHPPPCKTTDGRESGAVVHFFMNVHKLVNYAYPPIRSNGGIDKIAIQNLKSFSFSEVRIQTAREV